MFKILGRREFLRISALTTGAIALSSCAPTPAATPTKPPAAAPTTAPAAAPTKAPAAAPTTPPAAAAPTKAPEPTKPPAAAATVAPTQAPAAAATKAPAAPAAERIGRNLIGKLEGPEVITDPAKYPKTFKEAPALADLVKAGKLPPVQERVSQDPLVLKPVHEIGKYGGNWRRPFTGPADLFAGVRAGAGQDFPLYLDYTGNKIVPNMARAWEVGDGGRTLTLQLRRGMKWSDGQPFTVDDFMFWYEDIYQNKEVGAAQSPLLAINRKPGTLEKVDATTLRFKFPDPYYGFAETMTLGHTLTNPSYQGPMAFGGGYAPAHYLKQFHAKYVGKDEADKKAKEAKFDNWVNFLKFKFSWHLNPELPVTTPWKTVTPANTPTWTLERNPYSIWVDTDGNQLPYLDKIVLTLGENLEVINLRAIAGEYDMNARHMDIGKIPVFLENQQKGGYKLSINPMEVGSDYGIWFNLMYDADPELTKWFNNVDFRRALSIGIDREQINETFFLGVGIPGSAAPAETNKFSPGPEARKVWAVYDQKKAGEMLDKIGLDKKDSEGFRLRADGKGRLQLVVNTLGGQFVQYTQISEMVRAQWKKIGIDLRVEEVERSLQIKRGAANETQLFTWSNDGTDTLFVAPNWLIPLDGTHWVMPEYGKWLATGGTAGKEPPATMKQVMDLWVKGFGVPDDERVKIGKEIWNLCLDNPWYVGVAGQAGAVEGIQITKVNMGNVPGRFTNINQTWPPSIMRPVTFYWKS